MEIFFKDPLFSDYQNVESKEKLHWSSRKIEEWFRRQLKKKNQFATAMEKIFQKHQFLEEPNEALESESGGAWKRISSWMKNKRKNVLESFLKKDITVNEMPTEIATCVRLHEKYDEPITRRCNSLHRQKKNMSETSMQRNRKTISLITRRKVSQ
ncbi:hypothetical protein B9Z55_023370 [Caenorhabditis nigoni]|uniref:Homeobox domain-containing protein n=1 Tax=Caenorhabditis nigoni TaxID=1611254 RepID=A0A2G5SP99_9PELO|nr:hypothetical protein B9Z55_023370 [Caenorhabditis nigoni]